MPKLAVLAIISALLLSQADGETKWAAGESRAPRVGIFLDFDQDPSESSIAAMEQEVGAVLKATGAHFSWLKFRDAPPETFDDLAVLRFQGSCRMAGRDGVAADSHPLTLASSALSAGSVTSYGSVLCDQIRTCISGLLGDSCARDRELAFGRALGRVVAHELYHMLARTAEHTRTGVTKAVQTPYDLVRDHFYLDRQALQWLRSRLQKPPAISGQLSLKADR